MHLLISGHKLNNKQIIYFFLHSAHFTIAALLNGKTYVLHFRMLILSTTKLILDALDVFQYTQTVYKLACGTNTV